MDGSALARRAPAGEVPLCGSRRRRYDPTRQPSRGVFRMTHSPAVAAEHNAVLTAVGLVEQADLGVVQVTGPDRVAFLHGLASSDVKKLPVGRGQVGFLLNTTGHVVADLTILHLPDRLLVLVPKALVARVAADLEKFHIMEKVTVEVISAAVVAAGAYGPAVGDLLNDAFSLDVLAPDEFQHFEMSFEGTVV